MIECWKCHRQVDVGSKISFRAVCLFCGIDWHVCTNCRYYSPGKPNECLIPGTEYIRDREMANFCEDFVIKLPVLSSPEGPMKKAKQIFGEDLPKKKNPFLEE